MPKGIRGPKFCTIEGCGRPHLAYGWCVRHYKRWLRHGSTDKPQRPRRPAIERFWEKVDKNGPVPDYAPHLGPCWLWTGATDRGYGHFILDSRMHTAHRAGWLLLRGDIPDDYEVDHLCRVRHCVNPAHLEPVTREVNQARGIQGVNANSLKTHCPQGHPYDEKNTYIAKNGGRRCRACTRERSRTWRSRTSSEPR